MAFGARHSRALVLGASAFSFALMSSGAAFTQTLEAEAVTRSAEQKKQKQAKRQQAKPQQAAQAAGEQAPVARGRHSARHAPVGLDPEGYREALSKPCCISSDSANTKSYVSWAEA